MQSEFLLNFVPGDKNSKDDSSHVISIPKSTRSPSYRRQPIKMAVFNVRQKKSHEGHGKAILESRGPLDGNLDPFGVK